MVHLVQGDRYYIADGEAALHREGEKGIKKASAFQRIFGGSVKVIIDGKDIYLNKSSLDKYLNRRMKRVHGKAFDKKKEALQGFISSSQVDSHSAKMLRGDEAAKKRESQLKSLSQASLTGKKIKLVNQEWHQFYNVVSQEVLDIFFQINKASKELIQWTWSVKDHRCRVANEDAIPKPNRNIIESTQSFFQDKLTGSRNF